jgi:hypothetical protein
MLVKNIIRLHRRRLFEAYSEITWFYAFVLMCLFSLEGEVLEIPSRTVVRVRDSRILFNFFIIYPTLPLCCLHDLQQCTVYL